MNAPRAAVVQAVLTVPIVLALYGWQTVDLVEWRALTAAPFALNLDQSRQFLYGSPFTYLLGSYYQHQGLGFSESFIVVHGIGLALLAFAVVHALRVRCGSDYWAAGGLVLAVSPLLLIVVTWIGKADTFLVAFYLLLVGARSPLTRAALSVLMVLCHRELAVAMLAAHVLLRRDGVAVMAGALAGLALSFMYTNVFLDGVPPVTRFDYVREHARGTVMRVLAHPVLHFVAALGPFWVFVLRPSAMTVARVLVLAMAATLASMTVDFTRIFVLAATPLLIVLTEDLIAELRETGGIWLLGRRWPVATLGCLAFTQVQLAGDRLSFVRGLAWTVAP